MAYPVQGTITQSSSISASITVTLRSDISVGDIVVLFLGNDGGGTAIAESGGASWTVRNPSSVSGALRQAVAYKRVTSLPETNPTFTGATDEWSVVQVLVRDADATNFINTTSGVGYIATDFSTNPTNSGLLTTGAGDAGDGALLLYGWAFDGTDTTACVSAEGLVELGKDISTGQVCQIVGYRNQNTAGAAPTVTAYGSSTLEGGNGWVIAIKNASGGSRAPDCRSGAEDINWYGFIGNAHMPVTWQAPSNFAASINGITTDTNAPFSANSTTLGDWGTSTYVETNINSVSDLFCGGTHTISSTNMTGKVFSIHWATSGHPARPAIGINGVIVGFSDGTNWVTYQLCKKSKLPPALVSIYSKIALGMAAEYASSGLPINWGAVTRIGFFYHRNSGSTSFDEIRFKNACLFHKAELLGGGANAPVTFNTLVPAINSFGREGVIDLQGTRQVLGKANVQIGDGSTQTYFDLSATSFEYPTKYSADTQKEWNANSSSVTLSIYASGSDVINFTAGVAASDTLQAFTLDAFSSTSATYSFNGSSVIGFNVTLKTGILYNGITFSKCPQISAKGANLTTCTIKKTLAGASGAALGFDISGATVSATTIDVTGTSAGYHLELGTAVTAITLTDVTFTGTPGTNKVHVLATTGTVTITISGTTSLVAGNVTSAGATVVISAPALYQTVTISSAVASSEIQIYDITSGTELYNGVPTFPYTWTDPVAASANREIRLRCAYVNGVTAKKFIEQIIGTCGTLSTNKDVRYIVNQENDPTYNKNGINGPAIYATSGITFTDAAVDLVNCNIPGGSITWATIYACFVYWRSTVAGIANNIIYVNAPDTANYLFSATKIRNTNAADLTITGGWGRDATTGLSKDIIDTAGSMGNIFLAPDLVIPYATGSGVTAQDKADIASASATATLAAAQSNPIYSDARKMNGATIYGNGSSGNLWRGTA